MFLLGFLDLLILIFLAEETEDAVSLSGLGSLLLGGLLLSFLSLLRLLVGRRAG